MLWPAFAAQEPELAARGWELLAEEHGYVYLATVAPDGGPRLHPVAPIRADRGLFVAVMSRSPKLADIRREPRVALHTTVRPPDDEEFSIRGIAREVEGVEARAAAVAGARDGATLSDAMTLFELDLLEIGWARWEQGHPRRMRWRAIG
jgi:Pyridoxamine 5'-phosphate oxidase